MFVKLLNQRTANVQKPFFFGGSPVPTHLGIKNSQYSGGMIVSEKTGKGVKKMYQKGKEMIKK